MTGSSPEAGAETTLEETPAVVAEGADASPPADSSTAETAGAEKAQPSLIDSVKDALKGTKPETSPDSAKDPADPTATQPDGQKPEAEPELGDLTEEELKRYAPKTQKRMRQLLAQRAEIAEELGKVKGRAELFDRIENYSGQHGLSGEDVEHLLEIGALIRGDDPQAAIDRLNPIFRQLLERAGYILTPELEKLVNEGHLTEEQARRLVNSETRADIAETRRKETEEKARTERLRREAQTHVGDVKSVATEWETKRAAKDPDWPKKQARVNELIELEVYRNGYPKTKDDVVKMLNDIAKKVTEEVRSFAPKPREIIPARGEASSTATTAPKTALEAARIALGGR